eukprot:2099042-Amphidinium_carterae.1
MMHQQRKKRTEMVVVPVSIYRRALLQEEPSSKILSTVCRFLQRKSVKPGVGSAASSPMAADKLGSWRRLDTCLSHSKTSGCHISRNR